MHEENFKTDHDILITLVANMKELRTKQIENHQEIKDELNELKGGYSHRLDVAENRIDDLGRLKLASSDFSTFRNEWVNTLTKIETRLTWHDRIVYGGVGILFALELYFRFLN